MSVMTDTGVATAASECIVSEVATASAGAAASAGAVSVAAVAAAAATTASRSARRLRVKRIQRTSNTEAYIPPTVSFRSGASGGGPSGKPCYRAGVKLGSGPG